MNLFNKKISKKVRVSLQKALARKNPFIGTASKSKLLLDVWFKFLERLTITGFFIYILEKTHNNALRVLVAITLMFWFFIVLDFFFTSERLITKAILHKSKKLWQFTIGTLLLIGLLLYLINSFIDLFRLLR